MGKVKLNIRPLQPVQSDFTPIYKQAYPGKITYLIGIDNELLQRALMRENVARDEVQAAVTVVQGVDLLLCPSTDTQAARPRHPGAST